MTLRAKFSEWQRFIAGDSRDARALLPAVILAATLLAYLPALALGFVFDDQVLILTNDSIRSWRYFPSYFTSHIWAFRSPHLLANYYRPLFLAWLRLNDAWFGLRPWGWHLTSVAAHLAVTYLVYLLCRRLLGDARTAAGAALLFGVHPVHVEAVADITSVQEPLSTFFILAALLAFARSRGGKRQGLWLAASLAFTAMALLSKESALVLPLLIGTYIWVYDVNDGAAVLRALRASLPYWAVVVLYLPLRIRALHGFAHVVTPLSWAQLIYTVPSVLLFYLRLLVWPSGLSCYYDTPYISTPGWRDFAIPCLLLAGAAGALVYWHGWARRRDAAQAGAMAVAGWWMLLTLLPALNFRFLLHGEIAHDRYIYLPSVGFTILVAIAVRQALRAVPGWSRRPAWVLGSVLVFSGVLGGATARQCLFWSDDLVLSVRSHAIAPHNVSATSSLAAAVAARGMEGQAVALYQQALSLQPDYWVANRNLGYIYYNHGDYPQAVDFLARSLRVGPEEGDQFLYLGMALLHLGRFGEADKAVRTALLLRPQGRNYHLALGMILRAEGNLPDARQAIESELATDPRNSQAQALLKEVEEQMRAAPVKPAAPPPP